MDIKRDITLQQRVLVVGLGLMGIKMIAWMVTGANAIFSDMMESLVNVLAGGFALFSLRLASRPKDVNHPYGHGKVEFISGAIEGVLIVVAGILIGGKALYDTIHPHEVSNLDLGLYLTALAGGINFFMGVQLVKRGKAHHSMTLISEGEHLKSDGYSSAALLVGIALVWVTGIVWLDNVVAFLFAVFILVVGIRILRKSIAGIMDEADFDIIVDLVAHLEANRKPNWMDIHNLRVIRYGRALHVDCHLTLPNYYNLEQVHHEVDVLEQLIDAHFENPTEVFVHADPCKPACCELCSMVDCPIRSDAFRKQVPWTVTVLVENSKHQL